ncbi:hypothetical protein [Ferroacidibacillus organovorans]|uniref:G5 domain-containing protein n=2 Tax=Ferroacidibacillus organovorans TaxID=1765683 RepID=A0A117SYQ0_9BACL|nr:hypothetical protein [Ferroacidibacillus organovorans]KUO97266.1 hypothetical protein ATW55_11795 [Ferroacidibacillus organovorans]KYP80218.1 hypothetical protein AYJ22_12155 [Ferroacidibacillus organovorans]OAG93600.1 hypothetical protein AYW79_09570 [Ferroacidibacillus organovorans]OPG17091.1 hypothetical protein B2M26_03220 [Ferroacidibacillus organovorans]
MFRWKSAFVGVASLFFAPSPFAWAAMANSNPVTITGGYDRIVQTEKWEQIGTTQQAYTYQADVTTVQSKRVQTGTTTRMFQIGTKQQEIDSITRRYLIGTQRVQTGTTSICDGEWMYDVHLRRYECSGGMIQKPVYKTVPVYRTETIPLYQTVPVYRTQTIPIFTIESVPVTRVETFTGYRNVPEYGWVTVNTEQWVPVVIQ